MIPDPDVNVSIPWDMTPDHQRIPHPQKCGCIVFTDGKGLQIGVSPCAPHGAEFAAAAERVIGGMIDRGALALYEKMM